MTKILDTSMKVVKCIDSAKLSIDRVLDKVAIPSAVNSAFLYGAIEGSELLESLQSFPDDLKPLAVTLAAVAGLYPLNKYGVSALSNAAKKYNDKRLRRHKGSGLIGWGKTALIAYALVTTLPRIELAVSENTGAEQEPQSSQSTIEDNIEGNINNEIDGREERSESDIDDSGYEHRVHNRRQPSRILLCQERYVPGSEEAVQLFEYATQRAELPIEWARSDSLHAILAAESQGWVGRPNYTITLRDGTEADNVENRDRWSEVHRLLRDGQIEPRSTATGLGQLILPNVDRFYPSGRDGLGDCIEEAIGMLRYIADRHENPDTAWRRYNSVHEGY